MIATTAEIFAIFIGIQTSIEILNKIILSIIHICFFFVVSKGKWFIKVLIYFRDKVQEEGLEEQKTQRKPKLKTESESKKTVTNIDASIQAG